jgi:hypothetical protein
MSGSKEIKEKFLNPALEKSDLAAIQQASEIWKCAAEAEKSEADTAKAKLESANFRFWIPALAPFAGALILALTVWVQFKQYNTNARDQLAAEKQKEEESERAQLQTALDTAKMPSALSTLASVTLIKSRLNSNIPTQRQEAREIAVSLLGATADPNGQALLFPAIFPKPDWSYFGDALRLSKMLKITWEREWDDMNSSKSKLDDLNKMLAGPTIGPGGMPSQPSTSREQILQRTIQSMQQDFSKARIPDYEKLAESVDQLQGDVNGLSNSSATVAGYIGQCLKLPGRPTTIDMSNIRLTLTDLSTVNLDDVILSDSYMDNLDLKNASLKGISKFDNSNWDATAWWRARAIAPALLKYLQDNYPYRRKGSYYSDDTKTFNEYRSEIDRLEKTARMQ